MKPSTSNPSLDPNVQPVFSKTACASALANKINSRDLFFELIHISGHYSVLPHAFIHLKTHLQLAKQHYAGNINPKYNTASVANLLKNADYTNTYNVTDIELSDCLVQYAPVAFTELGWLATITQTVTNQSPLATELMAMYLRLAEGKLIIAQNRDIYRAHLLNLGFEIPAVHTLAFSKQSEVGDELFDFATIQLAFGQFPRVFFPEILGFTLSYLQSNSLLERFFPESDGLKLPDFLIARNASRKQEIATLTTLIKAYLTEYNGQTETLWQRIQAGFWLHQQQLDLSGHRIITQQHTMLSPRQSVEKLLATLIPNAIGHHSKIRLGSRTLDEWFQETPFKSVNFLASLLQSPYVDRAKPENSKLLTLFEFNGPMFGVLDENGKTIIRNWLLSELNPGLAQGKKQKAGNYKVGLKSIASDTSQLIESTEVSFDNTNVSQDNYSKLSNRGLYYYLVNIDLYPEALLTAKARVDRMLSYAKLFSSLPFRRYTHQVFEGFISSVYQHEVKSYKPLAKKPKLTKADFTWGIEQFAPTILTDGCWLQDIQQLVYFPSHAIGSILHKIYQDEIGNGILAQNHPHIYQELLESLAINLPPINTKEFVKHSGFLDSAFDIPVYLMAISKFPNTFLPELLGLNMAIEISGLGNVYLRLSEELKFWGIPSAIVDIHTSIDNLSTGHSALAIKAIQAYLDEISANYGEDIMQAHWRRIYTGYVSLNTVSTRLKYSLIAQYFLKRKPADTKKTGPVHVS